MLLDIVDEVGHQKALEYIDKYFGTQENGRPNYTGSHFETFADGGDAPGREHMINADDLLAVSCLAVYVPAQASIGLLGPSAEPVGRLLAQLPADRALGELSNTEYEELLGPTSPGQNLWDLLRQNNDGTRWKVGETTASKILARKRPHLFPIIDSVVRGRTGLKNDDIWRTWHQELQATDGDDSPLVRALTEIHADCGQPHLSLLRVLDIVLWMDGTQEGKSAPRESVD
ncbi:DUF6308 family protein [Arthrobacter crystallopoietes]|uniref:DUF6308 family protein n=1 Tax=Crystallibacter crystallopoietes TaxID=37928 RepID=UPI003D2320A7